MKAIDGFLLYDIHDIAEKLGVTERSAYEHIRNGEMRAVKFGRSWHVSVSALGEFLEGRYHGQKEQDDGDTT